MWKGRACSTHETDEVLIYTVFVGKCGGRRSLGRDRDVDGRIILKWILKK
jgi:hypothetical protein